MTVDFVTKKPHSGNASPVQWVKKWPIDTAFLAIDKAPRTAHAPPMQRMRVDIGGLLRTANGLLISMALFVFTIRFSMTLPSHWLLGGFFMPTICLSANARSLLALPSSAEDDSAATRFAERLPNMTLLLDRI